MGHGGEVCIDQAHRGYSLSKPATEIEAFVHATIAIRKGSAAVTNYEENWQPFTRHCLS